MKKLTLSMICLLVLATGVTKAQQVNNSGFENWDNLGAATEEPSEWNSFRTASGTMAAFVSQQLLRSPLSRPGSTGIYSCVIWSKVTLTIVANGVVTTGQVNAGSATPTDAANNYNVTHTAQPAFSEALGAKPDSLVIWVRFKPANASGTDSARVRAIVHDTYDFRDPSDAASIPHNVGEATLNFCSTNNQWIRKSFPFTYAGAATSPDFILINITTNKTPGSGSAGDSLYVDDLELIYNPDNIADNQSSENLHVYTDANDLIINLAFNKPMKSEIALYNVNGQMVYNSQVNETTTSKHIALNTLNKGIYIVSVTKENGERYNQKIAIQ